MKIFDFLEEEEEKLIDELYEDPISKSLTELEKSIEDSIIQPDSFEPPVLYQPVPLVLGGSESSSINEYNLGPNERTGLYEVPIHPLRMSGGSRRPFKKRGFPGLFPKKNRSSIRNRNHNPERCPLMDDRLVIIECSSCMHFLTFYEFSHCSIKEDEYLEARDEENEENR